MTLLTSEADFHLLSPTPDNVPFAWRNAPAALVLAMTLNAQEALLAAGWDQARERVALARRQAAA